MSTTVQKHGLTFRLGGNFRLRTVPSASSLASVRRNACGVGLEVGVHYQRILTMASLSREMAPGVKAPAGCSMEEELNVCAAPG
jgi:hypothetical protein